MTLNSRASLVFFLWHFLLGSAQAQRFLRDGFTSKLDEEFKYEAGLDNNPNSPVGMPREMFVLTELDLEVSPPTNLTIPSNRALTRHLHKHLDQPLKLQLEQRKGGIGYRAFGVLPNGKRLRGSWRRGEAPQKLLNSDFLTVSYDEAVRSRLLFLEIEMALPRLSKRQQQQQASKARRPPRVLYQLAVEGGVMIPKAVLPRGDAAVQVLYSDAKDSTEPLAPPTAAKLGLRMKPGLVDPGWARGRTILRKGRSAGVI